MYVDLGSVSVVDWSTLLGRSTRHTLLLEKSSFTPRPELLCMMVLYSPSSSSLKS